MEFNWLSYFMGACHMLILVAAVIITPIVYKDLKKENPNA